MASLIIPINYKSTVRAKSSIHSLYLGDKGLLFGNQTVSIVNCNTFRKFLAIWLVES